MALNFPDSPTVNQIYTDSTSGFSYQWDGTVWKSYSAASTNTIRTLDDISGSFDDVTTIFALTASGDAVSPANAQQLLISIGGVLQSPNTDYSVSGSNIIFTTAPQSGLTFFGTLLGTAVPVGVSTVGDVYRQQSYSVTGVQTSFSFPAGYTVGFLEVYRNGVRLISGDDFTATDGSSFDLTPPAQDGDGIEAIGYITSSIAITNGYLTDLTVVNNARVLGITTLGTNVGAGETALFVEGNARITGILTVGSSSVTIDGTTDTVTATSFVGDLTGTASTATAASNAYGLLGTPDLNVGIVTATSFSGDGSGLTGIVTSVNPVGQTTTSQSPTTTIDLSLGSVIYFTHNTDTTVAFANTATTQEITFIRTKDDSGTPRSITWPSSVKWPNFGTDPTLITLSTPGETQTFKLITRDGGTNWYGWEEQRYFGDNTYLFAAGFNSYGQLGQNNTTRYSSPVQIPGITWSSISGGGSGYSLATKTDGTLWAWGENSLGELGQNNVTDYSSPRQIPGTTWSSIAAGFQHSLALKTDGTLWGWGVGDIGRLGQNDTIRRSSPVQIPGTTWSSISSGQQYSLALKTDGTLWGWGRGANGQLGQNDQVDYSSPVQIPGTTWSSLGKLGGEASHSLATKTDGTLWAWGQNQYGQLAQTNQVGLSSPIQIPGTNWSYISGGGAHSLATKTDGTLWAWGLNNDAQLGQNNVTSYSSPVQIPGTTWNYVSSGGQSLATKTDGTLWVWGTNSSGQLGQNNRITQSNPIQIPGIYWLSSASFSGGAHLLALSKTS